MIIPSVNDSCPRSGPPPFDFSGLHCNNCHSCRSAILVVTSKSDHRNMRAISGIRNFAKSCALVVLGPEARPRTITRGAASGYRICVSPTENPGYLPGTAEPRPKRPTYTIYAGFKAAMPADHTCDHRVMASGYGLENSHPAT